MMDRFTTTPRRCPACDAELYPIARLRPAPGLSRSAKMLLTIGCLCSSAVFIAGMVFYVLRRDEALEEGSHMRPIGGLSGIVTLIPAVVPGLIFGWLAYRLPKALRLRCPRCSWSERYLVRRDGRVMQTAVAPMAASIQNRSAGQEINQLFAQINSGPPKSPASSDVEGETQADVSAWVYGEIGTGRSPEAVAAQLVAIGWPADEAEHLAELGRRRTRHLR